VIVTTTGAVLHYPHYIKRYMENLRQLITKAAVAVYPELAGIYYAVYPPDPEPAKVTDPSLPPVQLTLT
jgi:hypothetical protein